MTFALGAPHGADYTGSRHPLDVVRLAMKTFLLTRTSRPSTERTRNPCLTVQSKVLGGKVFMAKRTTSSGCLLPVSSAPGAARPVRSHPGGQDSLPSCIEVCDDCGDRHFTVGIGCTTSSRFSPPES